jgi:hypothetical protein
MRARVLFVLLCATVTAQEKTSPAPLTVELLGPDPARDARVTKLVDELTGIAKSWYGISDTSGGGVAFDAIDTREIVPNVLRDLPRAGPSHAFRELVRLGPAAIPGLLKHLDDKRETKLSFQRDEQRVVGGMHQQPELYAGCADERALIVRILGVGAVKNPTEPSAEVLRGEWIQRHTVTVGDCCFAILGQIVNRSYEAVRYQPKLITVVSSPTRDPRIAKALRTWWGRGDPRQTLAQSLYRDIVNPEEWSLSNGAALRLLTYFPGQAGPILARCIAEVWDGRLPAAHDGYRHHCQAEWLRVAMSTGHPLVRTEWLKLLDPQRPSNAQLAALAATPEDPGEDARSRIRTLREESKDLDLFLACIEALPGDRSPKVFARLRKEFAAVETRDAGQAQRILAAMARLDEDESLSIFVAHIKKLGRFGQGNVLAALHGPPRPRLAVALLPSLLETTDPVGHLGAVRVPVKSETRWCDWAAAILAEARPDLPFDAEATVEERDRQIAAMREALKE